MSCLPNSTPGLPFAEESLRAIRSHEGPNLPGKHFFQRIFFHILDAVADLAGGMEEDLIRTMRPNRIIGRDALCIMQRLPSRGGQIVPDEFRPIPMRSHDRVRVVRADRTGTDRVSTILRGSSE